MAKTDRAQPIKAARGVQDWSGESARALEALESRMQAVVRSYSYEPVRLPMMESVALFKRGVGEATDIVEKEMFLLAPRQDDERDPLALRPEGTASCVRALLEQGLLFNQQQRVYYSGSMFRYERPQKGRYREFYQLGAEAFGIDGPALDAELLALGLRCWQELGIANRVTLELNSIGSAGDRRAFGADLLSYLEPRSAELDEDSQRRLKGNPLRILDSKDPGTRAVLADAPQLEGYLSSESREHFEALKELLDTLGIQYTLNPALVRGLDYYNDTVFEWVTEDLGAQGTICSGGRYDGLVGQLGGRSTPAAGFAMGLERVLLLCEAHDQQLAQAPVDAYFCVASDAAQRPALALAESLRSELPELRLRLHLTGGKLEKQLKRADATGAAVALIMGSDELAQKVVQFKPLRGQGEPCLLTLPALFERLRKDVLDRRRG